MSGTEPIADPERAATSDNAAEVANAIAIPAPPEKAGPDNDRWREKREAKGWNYIELYNSIYEALFVLPDYFKSTLSITGVFATDLFTFSTSLGATIENQVVAVLNELRHIWDSDDKYTLYHFVRQAQRFPDVILRNSTPGKETDILLGIELKGWYVLAKEGEPSLRFTVSPEVCAPWDFLVVFPWALTDVISGEPQLYQPFVENARYVAEYRNWAWQYKRESKTNKGVTLSTVNHYYPNKADEISDKAISDKGRNFGRIARTEIMDTYIKNVFRETLSGIPLDAWRRFFALFQEGHSEKTLTDELDRLINQIEIARGVLSDQATDEIKDHLSAIVGLIETGKVAPPPKPRRRVKKA